MTKRTTVAITGSFAIVALASCGGGGGSRAPTTPSPAAPVVVLPQAPTSCTFSTGRILYEARHGSFAIDLQWFPPDSAGTSPVTSYEVELIREAVKGHIDEENDVYEADSRRSLAPVTATVRAKTGTTDLRHSYGETVSFPLCDFLANGEDISMRFNVRAVSTVGKSLPVACVESERLWERMVKLIHAREYWRDYYTNLCDPRTSLSRIVESPDEQNEFLLR